MVGNFWCENCVCGAKGKEKDFQIEISKDPEKPLKCPNSAKSKLKLLGYKTVGAHIVSSKHAKGRTHIEREKRRSDDFKKNTLPELGRDEKRHFAKKFKKK